MSTRKASVCLGLASGHAIATYPLWGEESLQQSCISGYLQDWPQVRITISRRYRL